MISSDNTHTYAFIYIYIYIYIHVIMHIYIVQKRLPKWLQNICTTNKQTEMVTFAHT